MCIDNISKVAAATKPEKQLARTRLVSQNMQGCHMAGEYVWDLLGVSWSIMILDDSTANLSGHSQVGQGCSAQSQARLAKDVYSISSGGFRHCPGTRLSYLRFLFNLLVNMFVSLGNTAVTASAIFPLEVVEKKSDWWHWSIKHVKKGMQQQSMLQDLASFQLSGM